MRTTIRALAAAAALAGLLAASGPADAKIMQLTLGGNPSFIVVDHTDYIGGGGAYSGNDAYMFNFYFTYDTDIPNSFYGTGVKLLSARLEIRGDIYNTQKVYDPNGGEYIGAFNMPVGENAQITVSTLSGGYYDLFSALSTTLSLDAFKIDIPLNGTDALDQEMTYYPDHNYAFNNIPGYGNSRYDLNFIKYDANGYLIYDIETGSDYYGNHPDAVSGDISTRYVDFKDITPGGVPEPTAWALMLLGLGGVGAALRRRRAVPTAA